MKSRQHAEDDAYALLAQVWPMGEYPVDPVKIARQLGLHVRQIELPENVSGALLKERGFDPVIYLDERDSINRKRFSCAHELGHYVDRQDSDSAAYEYIDWRGESASNGQDPAEIYANQFAAALLMPEPEVIRLYESGRPSFLMASYFGVSDDAMRFRLKNLKLGSSERQYA